MSSGESSALRWEARCDNDGWFLAERGSNRIQFCGSEVEVNAVRNVLNALSQAEPPPDHEDFEALQKNRRRKPAPTGEADKAEDTETICAAITKLLGVEDPRPFDLLNLVAAYAMRCEDDGRRHEKLYQRIKALEFQNGFMPDRRVGQPAGDVALRAEDVEDQLRRLARWFDGRPHIRGVFYGMAADEALSCLADNLSSRPPGGAAEWRNTSEQMPADRLPVLVDGGIAMWRDGVWYTGMEEPWFQRPIEWTVRRWAPITAALNRLSADPPGGESQ